MNRTYAALVLTLPLFALAPATRAPVTSSPAARSDTTRSDTTRTRELVAVYIGMKHGIGENLPQLNRAIDSMNHLLGIQARSRGDEFVSVGVSLDPVADVGYNYLRSVSHFNEYVVGHGWLNLAAEHYIWADASLKSAVPQVIVLEREVLTIADVHTVNGRDIRGGEHLVFGSERVLARHNTGWNKIVAWVNAGAPLQ